MTLSNFLAISISGAAKIELMESESHKQKCELYTWNYVSWCNKRRALVRACVFPHDRLWKRGKTHVVHSQSDFECVFCLGDSWERKNAEKNENQEFDVCLRRHISSFTGGSAVMFGSLQRLWVFIVCSLFTKRVLVWKVVPDHFEIHEIVEKTIFDLLSIVSRGIEPHWLHASRTGTMPLGQLQRAFIAMQATLRHVA